MRRALQFVGGLGVALFAVAAWVYLTLPDVRPLRTVNPATTAFQDLRAEEARAKGLPVKKRQQWVPIGRISRELQRAVTIAEDDAFWQHEGIDFNQLQESIETDLMKGRMARGGSTITQQLAKNLYLSPSKNPFRKLRELLITRRLEAELPKRRILEIYLNVIEWGDGIWGAEAAAQAYFHTSAASIGTSDAALLAGSIPNPRHMNPGKVTPGLKKRQQIILKRMGGSTETDEELK